MASELAGLNVRVIDAREDASVVAALRALAAVDADDDPTFQGRMSDWLAQEAERRTIWVATLPDLPVGMASLLEYRRMPRPGHRDSRWGYVGNVFVRENFRNRGIGSTLLNTVIVVAEERGYSRLVLSPQPRALPFFRRSGFIVPDEAAGDHRLLVRRC
jgi:GNAT superfamily N-acetyltransferase